MKLVDRIGYLDDAVKETKRSLKLNEAKLISYYRPGSYKGTIYSGFPQAFDTEINLIAINGDFLSLIPEVQFMYLWRPWKFHRDNDYFKEGFTCSDLQRGLYGVLQYS